MKLRFNLYPLLIVSGIAVNLASSVIDFKTTIIHVVAPMRNKQVIKDKTENDESSVKDELFEGFHGAQILSQIGFNASSFFAYLL